MSNEQHKALPKTHGEREQWLAAVVDIIRPLLLERAGLELPPVRVGVADLGEKVGGTTHMKPAKDDAIEITVSMRQVWEHEHVGSHEIIGTLIHECIHASGVRGHYRNFRKAAEAMGLQGIKTTAMGLDVPREKAPDYVKQIIADLSEYPTPALYVPAKKKKQATRMIKLQCNVCKMILRTAAQWVERCKVCPDIECTGGLEVEQKDEAG